jgi:putative ABC transport system substrate-binding protein
LRLAESDPESKARIAALRDGLRKLGWIDGRNMQISSRWASGDAERARAAAPEVIFAGTTMSLLAVRRATKSVPIVFAQVADPVGSGFVASVAHPGGNITGFAQYEYEIATVWLELLKQLAPTATRIAVLYDPSNRMEAQLFLSMIETASHKYGLEISSFAIGTSDDISVQSVLSRAHQTAD